MPWFNNTAFLKLIDSMTIIIAQTYELARSRLGYASSPVMRVMNGSLKYNGSNVNKNAASTTRGLPNLQAT